jgi:AbrB family looped-hinge helix DNA binding protein
LAERRTLTRLEIHAIFVVGVKMITTDDSDVQTKVRLGPDGRIVIPAAVRQQLGLEPGVTLFLDVKDGIIHVESLPARVRRIQRDFAPFRKPGVLASDELIAERRAEAWREQVEVMHEMQQEPLKGEEKIA